MGEAAGQMIGILASEEDSRVVLIAMILFLVMIVLVIGLIAISFKLFRSIKKSSKEEFGRENEFSNMRDQVDETKEDIKEITQLIIRLTESVTASNKRTQKDLENIRKSLAVNNGGCDLGKALEKEVSSLKSEVLKDLREDISLLMESDKESIKAFITSEYHFWMSRGEIDIYSLASIKERFDKYQKEKGNTFVAGMMRELELLPKICTTQNCQTEHMIRERDEKRIIPHNEIENKDV